MLSVSTRGPSIRTSNTICWSLQVPDLDTAAPSKRTDHAGLTAGSSTLLKLQQQAAELDRQLTDSDSEEEEEAEMEEAGTSAPGNTHNPDADADADPQQPAAATTASSGIASVSAALQQLTDSLQARAAHFVVLGLPHVPRTELRLAPHFVPGFPHVVAPSRRNGCRQSTSTTTRL